jgi:hypothetical protein
MLISVPAVMQNVALITGILLMKVISKFVRTYYLNGSWIPEASLAPRKDIYISLEDHQCRWHNDSLHYPTIVGR